MRRAEYFKHDDLQWLFANTNIFTIIYDLSTVREKSKLLLIWLYFVRIIHFSLNKSKSFTEKQKHNFFMFLKYTCQIYTVQTFIHWLQSCKPLCSPKCQLFCKFIYHFFVLKKTWFTRSKFFSTVLCWNTWVLINHVRAVCLVQFGYTAVT